MIALILKYWRQFSPRWKRVYLNRKWVCDEKILLYFLSSQHLKFSLSSLLSLYFEPISLIEIIFLFPDSFIALIELCNFTNSRLKQILFSGSTEYLSKLHYDFFDSDTFTKCLVLKNSFQGFCFTFWTFFIQWCWWRVDNLSKRNLFKFFFIIFLEELLGLF